MAKLILYAMIGGGVGALINYLSDVLPLTRRFSRPVCPHCSNPYSLRNYLISFKCTKCGKGPALRNFLVLGFSILFSVLVGLFPFVGLNYWTTIPLMIFLGIILVIDIEHHVILIETSIVGLILMFVYGWLMQGWLLTAIGGIAGFLIMLLVYFFGILFSRGLGRIKRETSEEPGMGFGDVYVCAFLGFFTGWPYVIGMIILAVLASGVYSVVYMIIKSVKKDYRAFSTIPYAPFLILGAMATFYIPRMPI